MFSWLFCCLLVALTHCQACTNPYIVGEIEVSGERLFVAQSGAMSWRTPTMIPGGLETPANIRLYLAKECPEGDSLVPHMYRPFRLLGGSISYTVDLSSEVGCGCNAAFYLTEMPAVNSSGQYDPTDCDDYYCDANEVCGMFCPEVDLMEANNRAYVHALHPCDGDGPYYSNCQRSGCGAFTRIIDLDNAYGPDSSYTIDTSQPYQVTIDFPTNASTDGSVTLLAIDITLTGHDGATFEIHIDDEFCQEAPGYLARLSKVLRQSVLIIAFWHANGWGNMAWLDSPPCGGSDQCVEDGVMRLTDIEVVEGPIGGEDGDPDSFPTAMVVGISVGVIAGGVGFVALVVVLVVSFAALCKKKNQKMRKNVEMNS